MFRTLYRLLPLVILVAIGCSPGRVRMRDGGVGTDGTIVNSCTPGLGGFRCEGGESIECHDDGTDGERTNCTAQDQVCVVGLGCRTCQPNSFVCDANNIMRCNSDGTALAPHATCDASAGQECNSLSGVCESLCDTAARDNSYIGCEYYPVTTSNSQVDREFEPAVVIANPQSMPATVTITGPAGFNTTATVGPGATQTVTIPWVDALKNELQTEASALVTGGAYRLTSTVPVTVYQFNPLEYSVARDCVDAASGLCDPSTVDPFLGLPECDGVCFSYSNDASLLLPAHVMTGNYMVMSRPTLMVNGGTSPGFVNIVGVSETPVTVTVQLRANTLAGSGVTAFNSGDSAMFTLAQGDVVQLLTDAPSSCPGSEVDENGNEYCRVGAEFDLTGTEIRATGPIQVIAGHNCAFVPHNRWACDHLEEALFPLEAWDNDAIVSITQPLRSEPNMVRIISGHDANAITFDPVPSGVSNGMTLNRGQMVEFETDDSFRVSGTEAFLVGQFLVGQDYAQTGDLEGEGDPSFSLAIPSEQYRTDYTFLAPNTYPTNFVNVTAPTGATVTLDGTQVTGFTAIGSSGFGAARVEISSGQHNISSSQPFGIVVYGFGSYTSYMYPGGLDLEAINIPF
jgi:hypothetical protein